MAIEVRGIRPEEADDLIRAVSVGFGMHIGERDLEIEHMVLEPERAVAARDGDRFVGGSSAVSWTVSAPGAIVPAAGITGVSVLPTHRRRGILTSMMRRLLDDLREREPVSTLWAAEGAIYGRFGYGMATVGAELSIERPYTAFRPGYASSGDIRLVTQEEAHKLISSIYDRVATETPGFPGRNDAWSRYRWEIHDFFDDGFGKQYFFAVHEGAEGPDGYVAYRIKTDWVGDEAHTLQVEELVTTTPGAYADLWRYVFDVDLVKKVLAPVRQAREPLLHLLEDPNHLTVKLHDGLWIRLVRVAEALGARRYGAEGHLVLGVTDAFCDWNTGRYELVTGPQGAECAPTDADPDLELTAEDLGAVYLGGVPFRDLARGGRIAAAPEVLARADAMFGWDPPPWCPFVF